ncbi:PQQ-binding-like beta-propeller repeat protein [Streptomyces sp. 891-h]|uniref:outer membrane protein assembly factor BamB family protein n=1 Tax=Streptomyces sp. 891-h TaxID=2720714 RepID=UPI001FAA2E9F|nr:PQQ-binding-like beta-propeller repeat protein [Streptomyces sp. 891-h]UNZ17057.1 PQQ-binding-like beta-propeller repeat protein [Streptomyces sp. 891-h]
MEALRPDDPRVLGPYRLLSRLDDPFGVVPPAYQRFLARATADQTTVVITSLTNELAADTEYRARFRAEAENARRLAGAAIGLASIVDVSTPQEPRPWYAVSRVPGIALPSALVAQKGPLPERTVRVMGAVLAERLRQLHAAGHAHAGVTPLAVFLSASGPVLSDFGAVRTAGPDGEERSRAAGLLAECTPPEQLAGGRPRPLGDVFGLGCVLAYASTGQLAPELPEVPLWVRPIVSACLSADPAARPQPSSVAEELMDGITGGPGGTLPSGTQEYAADAVRRALSYGWLPAHVVRALAEQTVHLLAAEPQPQPAVGISQQGEQQRLQRGTDQVSHSAATQSATTHEATTTDRAAGAVKAGAVKDRPTAVDAPVAPAAKSSPISRLTPSRRLVLTGLTAGTTGAAVGFGMVAGGAFGKKRKTVSGQRVEGVAPRPLWQFRLKDSAPSKLNPFVWRDRVVVVGEGIDTAGIDLRNGKRRWTVEDLLLEEQPVDAGNGIVLLQGEPPTFVSAWGGAVRWQERKYDTSDVKLVRSLGVKGGVLFCFLTVEDETGLEEHPFAAAYDVVKHREIWRTKLPKGFFDPGEEWASAGGSPDGDAFISLKDTIVVPQPPAAGGIAAGSTEEEGAHKRFIGFDRRDGSEQWSRRYKGTPATASVHRLPTSSGHAVLSSTGAELRSFDVTSGRTLWVAKVPAGSNDGSYSKPVVHGGRIYVADGGAAVTAFDVRTGRVVWHRDPGSLTGGTEGEPEVAVSGSGRTVLVLLGPEVLTFSAEDGRMVWRFTDEPGRAGDGEMSLRHMGLAKNTLLVLNGRTLHALPVT